MFKVTTDTGRRDSSGAVWAQAHFFSNLGEWARFWRDRVADGTACRAYIRDPSFQHEEFSYWELVRSNMT